MDNIRSQLKHLENSIILYLIERTKFPINSNIYKLNFRWNNKIYKTGIFQTMLYKTEELHSNFGRYLCKNIEEEPLLYNYNMSTEYNNIKKNIIIEYIKFIKDNTIPGDDNNYGSTCICDINLIQAISKRMFLGKIVALTKLKNNLYTYVTSNYNTISKLIENKKVENNIIKRLKCKPLYYDLTSTLRNNLSVFYRNIIIPFTKQIQIIIIKKKIKNNIILYLGNEYSYTYAATKKLTNNTLLCSCNSFRTILDILYESDIKYAVLPYKNNIVGYIHEKLNDQHMYRGLTIIKRVTLLIEFGIGTYHKDTPKDLYIYSISFEETKEVLDKLGYLSYNIIFTKNNSDSIKKCIQNKNSICLSKLDSLKRNNLFILNEIKIKDNKTEFVLVEKNEKL